MIPQAVHIGGGSLARIGDLVAQLRPRRVMLVTGGASYSQSGAQDLIEPALTGLEVVRLSGIAPNPKLADIARGVALWRNERPPLILAAGGGSVLDVAKLTGLLGPSPDPWQAFLGGGGAAGVERVSVIAIPTTAGSGAEATRFATFYMDGEKQSLSHPLLRPTHAIVDPLLTASMPPEVAAATGLDALAQAIESFWAVGATQDSQALAEAAISEILPCLRSVARQPTPQFRERMAHGSHLAGRAIDISRTTAAHALSYALTANLDVPHGHAVALLLPSILRINTQPRGRPIRDPRGAAYLSMTVARLMRLLGCHDGEEAASWLSGLLGDLGLTTRLAVGPSDPSAAYLAGKVNVNRLSNNPIALSKRDAIDIYVQIFGHGGIA